MVGQLRNSIRQRLQPRENLANGARKTGFSIVTAQENGLYEVALASGAAKLRTKEETELHLLIEFHLSQVEANAAEPAPAAPAATEAPQPAVPENGAPDSAAPASHTQKKPQKHVRFASQHMPAQAPRTAHQGSHAYKEQYFDAQAIDLNLIDANVLKGGTHKFVKLSGTDYNCWWRGGMLVALFQLDPAVLRQRLAERLGDSYPAREADVAKLCEIGQAARQGQLSEILTGMHADPTEAATDTAGKLKLPGLSDAADNGEGEAVCKRLVRQLLLNAGEDEDVVDGAIDNTRAIKGDNTLIKVLLKQLGCSYALVNRNASDNPDHDGGLVTHGIEISPNEDSGLHGIQVDQAGTADASAIAATLESENVAWLVYGHAHFNMAISKRCLADADSAQRASPAAD